MKSLLRFVQHGAAFVMAVALFSGCESTDSGGGGGGNVSVYYGVGFYDPWYYGPGYYPPDIIVTPPDRPDRPVNPDRPRPEHPIANPTPSPTPRAAPSIPSMPRVSPRR